MLIHEGVLPDADIVDFVRFGDVHQQLTRGELVGGLCQVGVRSGGILPPELKRQDAASTGSYCGLVT